VVPLAVSVGQSNGRVEIALTKLEPGRRWSLLGVAGEHDAAWQITSTAGQLVLHTATLVFGVGC